MAKVTYSILLENAATFGTFSNPIYIDDPTQTRVMMQAGSVQLPYVGYRTASCNIIAKVKNDFTDTITQNGNYTITVPQGFCGISGGTLNINVPNQVETRNVGYVNNGNYTVTPSSGKIGISSIDIDVIVPRFATNYLYKNSSSNTWSKNKLEKTKIEPYNNTTGTTVVLLIFDNSDKHFKTITVNSNTQYPLSTPYNVVPLVISSPGTTMQVRFEDDNNKNLYQFEYNSAGLDITPPSDLYYCFGGCYPTGITTKLKRFKFYTWAASQMIEQNVNASKLNVDTSLMETLNTVNFTYILNGQNIQINSDRVFFVYNSLSRTIYFERLLYGNNLTFSNNETVLFYTNVPPNDQAHVFFGVQDDRNRYMYQEWFTLGTGRTQSYIYTVPSDLTW